MDKKEQTRLRVQRYRDKTKSVTDVTQDPDSVTASDDNVTLDVTQHPAILYALSDVKTRAKLRAICISLSDHRVLKNVSYGVSGPPMDIVSEYLTALT